MTKGKDFSESLLRFEEDGAEYFTVKSTGRSGMSQTGLSKFVGKTPSSISDWVKKVRESDPLGNQLPKPLKPFAGKRLTLLGYEDQQGRDILEDTFCYAIIKYYAWYAQDAAQNIQARQADELIGYFGMRSFIQIKTGWHEQCSDESFNKILELHEQRVATRNLLKDQVRLELMRAVDHWRQQNRLNRKIYSNTHDELNIVIPCITSQEIKYQNGLPKSALIRDYYDTEPLIDYIGVSRVATNLIKLGFEPIEAVRFAASFYLSPTYYPIPVTLVDNLHKVSKVLKEKKRERNQIESNLLFSEPKEEE